MSMEIFKLRRQDGVREIFIKIIMKKKSVGGHEGSCKIFVYIFLNLKLLSSQPLELILIF
jgi:hypothetical protein